MSQPVVDPDSKTSNSNTDSVNHKMHLISRNTADCIALDEIKEKLDQGNQLTCYLGMEPTRSPSLAYFIPLLKLADLIQADLNVVIFLADVHAFLNKGTGAINKTQERTMYYAFIVEEMLKRIGIQQQVKDKPDLYTFVKGSDVQLSKKYTLDLLKALTVVSVSQAKKAGSEVVKQDKDPKLSSIVYPLMQVLDENALDADIQIGGLDQRKIFALSRDIVERLGFKKCAYIMTNLLPSLGKPKISMAASSSVTDKMSSSDPAGKIDFLDSLDAIREKFKKAYCVEGDTAIDKSPCLAIAKYIVLPILGKLGCYDDFNVLLADWANKKILAGELKALLVNAVEEIISPIRTALKANYKLYEAAFE